MKPWRELSTDGLSRPDGDTARHVIARVLAERDGWAEIRPGHWTEAGAIVKALKVAGWKLGKRDRQLQGDAA